MAVPEKVMRDINQALGRLDNELQEALVNNAADAYITGEVSGYEKLGLEVAWNLVSSHAIEYVKEYRKDLVEKGGSIVTVKLPDGTFTSEFKDWFANSSDQQRTEVSDIIEKWIEEGGSLGGKEGPEGHMPGSLAEELSEYFDGRKSHAEMVARTEMGRIRTEAERARYKETGIEKLEWITADSPCDICDPLDGKVFLLEDCPPIPLHPDCECDTLPVADDTPLDDDYQEAEV